KLVGVLSRIADGTLQASLRRTQVTWIVLEAVERHPGHEISRKEMLELSIDVGDRALPARMFRSAAEPLEGPLELRRNGLHRAREYVKRRIDARSPEPYELLERRLRRRQRDVRRIETEGRVDDAREHCRPKGITLHARRRCAVRTREGGRKARRDCRERLGN